MNRNQMTAQGATTTSATVHVVPAPTVVVKLSESHSDVVLDVITGLLFCATVALAAYTAKLRKATVDLAGDTVEGNRLADWHHQETLSPVCTITKVESYGRGGERYGIKFRVHNVGSGPALLVNVTATPVEQTLEPVDDPGLKVESGFKKVGMGAFNLPYTLAAGQEHEHTFDSLEFEMFATPRAPDTEEPHQFVIVEVQFLTIFSTWGIGKWLVKKGESFYTVLSFELPNPHDRLVGGPRPNPLSAAATSSGGRVVFPDIEEGAPD